jgi:hypothetical protein
MKRPRRKNRTPPGGWYHITEDGSKIIGGHLSDLVSRVAKYYTVNEMLFNMDELEDIILDQICRRIPDDWCTDDGTHTFHPTTSIIEGATRAIIKQWTANGGQCEEDSTALARANVCLTLNEGRPCRYYRRQPTCWGCTALYKIMSAALGTNRSKLLENAHVCGICKCGIATIAYCKDNVLAAGTSKEQLNDYPERCWKRITLKEYYEKQSR